MNAVTIGMGQAFITPTETSRPPAWNVSTASPSPALRGGVLELSQLTPKVAGHVDHALFKCFAVRDLGALVTQRKTSFRCRLLAATVDTL